MMRTYLFLKLKMTTLLTAVQSLPVLPVWSTCKHLHLLQTATWNQRIS